MTNTVVYDAHTGPIHSVTVFQVNRADVNRRIELELKQGQNQVTIKNLPSILDQDSIRVDGIGDAVIFDVIYKSPNNYKAEEEKENPELVKLNERRNELLGELEIANSQSSILAEYSKTMKSQHATAEQLSAFLKTYATTQSDIQKEKTRINKAIAEIDKETAKIEKALEVDSQSLRRQAGVDIIVLANSDGPVELSLTYTVTDASWTPLYDVRADIVGAEEAKPSKQHKVDLHYRASIFQSTAEDWKDVHLTLSTASPQTGSSIPSLTSQTVLEDVPLPPPPPPIAYASMSIGGYAPGGPPVAAAAPSRPSVSGGSFARAKRTMPRMQVAATRADNSNQGFSSTFGIEGLSTIPSDTDSSDEKHKVTIAVVELKEVDLEWVTVPKALTTAFLRCQVKNTSEYILLPGEASIFMNNNFVSKSSIPSVSPHEYFRCSFGADSSIRITYHPQSKKINLPTGSLLGSKSISTAYSQRITIKNTRRATLERLLVRDQVPVSTDARIKVNVVQPDMPDLAPGSGLKEVAITGYKNVIARWAPVNEDEQGPYGEPNHQGYVEWICKMEPNTSMDLVLNWEINVPKELKWKLS